MVGLKPSTIADFSKDSKLPSPPHPSLSFSPSKFIDLPPSFDDHFPDFDSIEDWIIDPDSFPMQADPTDAIADVVDETQSGIDSQVAKLPGLTDAGSEGFDRNGVQFGSLEANPGEIAVGNVRSDEKIGNQGAGAEVMNCLGLADMEIGGVGSCIEKGMMNFSLDGGVNGNCEGCGVGGGGDGDAMTGECRQSANSTMENGDGASGGTVCDKRMDVEEVEVDERSNGKSGGVVSDGPSESDSDESESDDSSSSLSSSSSGEEEETSDDDDDDEEDDNDVKKEKVVGEGREIEEGEISDLGGEEISFVSDDEEEGAVKGPIRSKNELEILPPVRPLNAILEPHHQLLPVGVILSMMGTKVVVEGAEKHNPLSEGSILWVTESQAPLGFIDEIFGPVKNPYYVVRYNSEKDTPAGIHVGTAISFVSEFAGYILNDKNLYKKGYDASGENDEEVSDETEFSDDEKEAEYKRSQRMPKRGNDNQKQGKPEFGHQKKVHIKGGFHYHIQPSGFQSHEHVQPSFQPSLGSVGPQGPTNNGQHCVSHQLQGPPPPVAVGCNSYETSFSSGQRGTSQHCVPHQLQGPALPSPFSGNSCEYSHNSGQNGTGPPISNPAQAIGFVGGQPTSLLPQGNPLWSNGIPIRRQQMPPFGLPMNGMPQQQQPGYYHYQHQPPIFTGFLNGMPCQQQFVPNQMPPSIATAPCGNLPGGPPVAISLGNFPQLPFGMGFQNQGNQTQLCGVGEHGYSSSGQHPPPTAHSRFSAPHQFNPGMGSNRGRWRPPRGGRSNVSLVEESSKKLRNR